MNKITLVQTYKVEIPFYKADFDTDKDWDDFLVSIKDPKYRQELLDENIEIGDLIPQGMDKTMLVPEGDGDIIIDMSL